MGLLGIVAFSLNPSFASGASAAVLHVREPAEPGQRRRGTVGIVLGVTSGVLSVLGGLYLAGRAG